MKIQKFGNDSLAYEDLVSEPMKSFTVKLQNGERLTFTEERNGEVRINHHAFGGLSLFVAPGARNVIELYFIKDKAALNSRNKE